MKRDNPKECATRVEETRLPCPTMVGEENDLTEALLKTMLEVGEVQMKKGSDGYIATFLWFDHSSSGVLAHTVRGYGSLTPALLTAWDDYCIKTGLQIFSGTREEKT